MSCHLYIFVRTSSNSKVRCNSVFVYACVIAYVIEWYCDSAVIVHLKYSVTQKVIVCLVPVLQLQPPGSMYVCMWVFM